MKLPIAETFHSIQGEGYWVGTPMYFIRLAGCSVGKRIHPGDLLEMGTHDLGTQPPTLPTGAPAWQCHRFDGTPFWCDTDFNKHEEMEVEQVMYDCWEKHVCVTGGEPLIHPKALHALQELCHEQGKVMHIETSGTILAREELAFSWITCSPKEDYLPEMVMRANEVKLLVDVKVPFKVPGYFNHANVYLSPINDVTVGGGVWDPDSQANLAYAMELLQEHPNWRLSVQLHKYLGLR